MKLSISDPVLVAMGPDSRTATWGGYQFPDIEMLDDGKLMVTFNDCADMETAYGSEPVCMLSSDQGKTWTRDRLNNQRHGVLLDNGERLYFPGRTSLPMDGLTLPEPIGVSRIGHKIYLIDQVSEDYCDNTWNLLRSTPENPKGRMEKVTLNWENMLIRSCFNVLVRPTPRGRLRKAPDGTLWMPHYYMAGIDPQQGGKFVRHLCNYLFKSTDNGHTWDQVTFLPCYPDTEKYPDSEQWEGYGENDITVTPDGSLIRLIRTGDEFPCFFTRSADGGKTWSKPVEFDDHGVWPCLLTLKCGVTLATYGRPGVWVRATSDPSGVEWEDPIEIVHSERMGKLHFDLVRRATCGYTNMIPLDDRTVAMVHSDFTVPDTEGVPRKCIMFRTITVEK